MNTQHQAKKSHKLLIVAVLLGVGIAAATMVFWKVSGPDHTGTSATQANPDAGSFIGGPTDESSANGGKTQSDEAAAGGPGSSSAELGESSDAMASDTGGGQKRDAMTSDAGGGQRGSISGGVPSQNAEELAGRLSDAAGEKGSAEQDVFGATAVPKRDIAQSEIDGSAEADNASDPEANEDESGDPEDEENEEEPPLAPFEGNWFGRMESGVATTSDGQLNCGGADLNNFRLLFNDDQNNYVLFGSVMADSGALDRNRRFFYSIRGLVGADGVFGKGESWALDKRAELGNYEVGMSGYFSGTQAIGSWQDNLGCSGTWEMSKQ